MRLIQLALVNVDTTVGATKSNTDKAIAFARKFGNDSTIVSFQEQLIGGYPSEDLIQWQGFVDEQWRELKRFAQETRYLLAVFTLGLTVQHNDSLFNAVAVVNGGKIIGIIPKEKLPTYGVFYEMRTFSLGIPGKVSSIKDVPFGDLIFKFPFGTMAVEVCEDIWSPDGPMRRRAYNGAELIINASASPWRAGVVETRREMIKTRSSDNQATVVYVNQFGGQDSLAFDGGGFVAQNGRLVLEMGRWKEHGQVVQVDLDTTTRLRSENTTWRTDQRDYSSQNSPILTVETAGPRANHCKPSQEVERLNKNPFLPDSENPVNPRIERFEDLLAAMRVGLAGYFEKVGFERIGIALSGGKDSVLSLIVCWLYAQQRFADLDPIEKAERIQDFIHCFSMPSHFNSEETKGISRLICEELGVTFKEISIEEAFAREVEAAKSMLKPDQELTPITLQNIQARIRGQRMWNWVNSSKGLWIQTGNMSEKAVGYTTIGGDMMGGYSLIGNLPKSVIIELLDYLRAKFGWIALGLLAETKASAELATNQEDEKDLMPFPVLDQFIYYFASEKLMPSEIYRKIHSLWTDEQLREMRSDYQTGMLKAWVKQFVQLFVRSIFKWVQAPQSVHLGSLEIDRERALQLPVVQKKEWLEEDLALLEEMED